MRTPTSQVFGKLNFAVGLIAAGSMLASAGAQAATTWTFDVPPTNTGGTSAQCSQTSPSAVVAGNNVSCFTSSPSTGGVPTVKATGWANTGEAAGAAAGSASGSNTIQSGYVTIYPNAGATGAGTGLGLINQNTGTIHDPSEGSNPEHAIDNNATSSPATTTTNAIYDMVLMEFSSAVTLTSLTVGWASGDADMTILACETGSACLDFTTTAKTYANLAALGWTYVEHSATNGATTGARLINGATNADTAAANSVNSKYWLIGAYNPTLGTADRISGAGSSYLNVGNDNIKLLGLSAVTVSPPGPPGSVPEPGSIALLGLAALGAVVIGKRNVARMA